MWPTDASFILLSIGLIPLFVAIVSMVLYSSSNSVSLVSMYVIVNWFGYHFNPWVAFLGAYWSNRLLVESFVDEALVFSTLSMLACLLGARIANKNIIQHTHLHLYQPAMPFRINAIVLGLYILFVLISFIIYVGGLDQVFYSSTARGAGQFDERTTYYQINNINTTFLHFLSMVLAVISTMYIIQQKHLRDFIFINLGYLGLLVASLRGVHYFSRAGGLALVISAIVLAKINGFRSFFSIIVCLFLSLIIGHIGYTQRDSYTPGLANFAMAAGDTFSGIFLTDETGANHDETPLTELNLFSGVESWTLKAWSSTLEDHFFYQDLADFLINLNPLPSIILPSKQIGIDLSKIAGTQGITGITTPFLADIYYVFGHPGALLMVLFGYMLQRMDNNFRKEQSSLSLIIVFFGMIATIAGVQKDVRTIMRPLWYALVLYLVQRYNAQRRELTNIPVGPQSSPSP